MYSFRSTRSSIDKSSIGSNQPYTPIVYTSNPLLPYDLDRLGKNNRNHNYTEYGEYIPRLETNTPTFFEPFTKSKPIDIPPFKNKTNDEQTLPIRVDSLTKESTQMEESYPNTPSWYIPKREGVKHNRRNDEFETIDTIDHTLETNNLPTEVQFFPALNFPSREGIKVDRRTGDFETIEPKLESSNQKSLSKLLSDRIDGTPRKKSIFTYTNPKEEDLQKSDFQIVSTSQESEIKNNRPLPDLPVREGVKFNRRTGEFETIHHDVDKTTQLVEHVSKYVQGYDKKTSEFEEKNNIV